MNAEINEHPDKYNDPRVQITRRGLLLAAFVVLFGICGAAFSIWARRTHLDRTRAFWGDEVIEALQLAEEIHLQPSPESAGPSDLIRLTGMPGLGHLRHVLLDERSYDWDTAREDSIDGRIGQEPAMELQLTDPTARRFPDTQIVIALDSGWVGLRGGNRQVCLNDRFRTAMPNFLRRIANYEPIRAENRKQDAAQEAP
ncbi:hypothetical protein FYK55_00340 [Roseiconus nitratireducens]|uniref:Uncharacterized protein n=1 Tax=Roseiconus nitratireducens TaxID=2605748 RepID=A0A5M6DKX6_9BACT|nr:hypothetical protein [Roseiconus nitratireducens]KAA5546912.1 hypothetical protein FYK55_00340 [Roseiconus nitratireducens]